MRTVASSRWRPEQERGLLGWLLLPLITPFVRVYEWAFYQHRLSQRRFMTRDEWDAYHSEWRFANGLWCYLGPPSYTLYNIRWPLLANVAVSLGVAAWSQSSMPKIDATHMPNMWNLGNFALALLLAFRLRAAYERWWLARTAFEIVCSQVSVLCAQFAKYCGDRRLVSDCARWCIVWQFAVLQNSTGAKQLHASAQMELSEAEAAVMAASTKTRVTAANKVRRIIVAGGLTEGEKESIELAWRSVWENAATCARIALTGFPYSVSLFTTGFICMWILFLPLTYLGSLSWWGVLPIFVVAVLLLGIDEISTQLEDPWELLPLNDLLNGGVADIRSQLREDEEWQAMEDGSCGSGASRSDSLHKGACSLDEGAEEGEERV